MRVPLTPGFLVASIYEHFPEGRLPFNAGNAAVSPVTNLDSCGVVIAQGTSDTHNDICFDRVRCSGNGVG